MSLSAAAHLFMPIIGNKMPFKSFITDLICSATRTDSLPVSIAVRTLTHSVYTIVRVIILRHIPAN